MSQEPLPERFHRFVQRLMGVKKRPDPRTAEGPLFGTFQDRVFASMMDMALIFLIFNELFAWISAIIYSGYDPESIASIPPEIEHAPIMRQLQYLFGQWVDSGFAALWVLNSFIHSVIIGVVLVAFWAHFHTTPGKFIVGLRMAGKNGEGYPTLRDYIRRYLGFYLSMPIFMIGFAALGFDKQKRAWHDRIAGTTVIYTYEGGIFRRTWDLLKKTIHRAFGRGAS